MARGAENVLCDFCGTPGIVAFWERRVRRRSVPRGKDADSWAACRECDQLVREQRWGILANVMTERHLQLHPGAEWPVKRAKMAVVARFRRLMTGRRFGLSGQETKEPAQTGRPRRLSDAPLPATHN